MTRTFGHRAALLALVSLCAALPLACDNEPNMVSQPFVKPFAENAFFRDGAGARPLVEFTVTREGHVISNAPESEIPPRPPMSRALLNRGRTAFEVSCAPCHGHAGYGDGMVVRRGYPAPPSLHTVRLRNIDDRHIYRVILNGLGKMPPYAEFVDPQDRWAVVAYLRALQTSQGDVQNPGSPDTQTPPSEDAPGAPANAEGGTP